MLEIWIQNDENCEWPFYQNYFKKLKSPVKLSPHLWDKVGTWNWAPCHQQPQHWGVETGEKYWFAKDFNLLTPKGIFHNLSNEEYKAFEESILSIFCKLFFPRL